MQRYHAWDAASNSRLSRLLKSAAHLKAYLDGDSKDSEAQHIGRAIHSAVLEPDDFEVRYVKGEPCAQPLKSGNRKGEPCGASASYLHTEYGWLCGVHVKGCGSGLDTSKTVLSEDDYLTCLRVRDAVHRMQSARGLIFGPGEVEFSMLWTDRQSGVLCKARWDRHSPEIAGGAIIDLKTTRDASPREFERSIFAYGYHRQAAMYLMGAKALRLPARHFSIIAVEKEPPFGCAVYRMTEGAIDAGEEQVKMLLRRYALCMDSNDFPGYPDVITDVALPSWAWGQIDDELQREAVA